MLNILILNLKSSSQNYDYDIYIYIYIYKIKKINIHELLFKSIKTLGNIVSVDTC